MLSGRLFSSPSTLPITAGAIECVKVHIRGSIGESVEVFFNAPYGLTIPPGVLAVADEVIEELIERR
jgi:hypothetical protein